MENIQGAAFLFNNVAYLISKKNKFESESINKFHSFVVNEGFIESKIKNFRRFNLLSKEYTIISLLALYDAGINLKEKNNNNIGIISTDSYRTQPENRLYFKDYLESGKKLGRGNLFVYTLPSTPLGNVAISLNLQGTIMYFNFEKDIIKNLISQANFLVNINSNKHILALCKDPTGVLALILNKNFNINYDKLFDISYQNLPRNISINNFFKFSF